MVEYRKYVDFSTGISYNDGTLTLQTASGSHKFVLDIKSLLEGDTYFFNSDEHKINNTLYDTALPEGLQYSEEEGLTIGIEPKTITINPKVFDSKKIMFGEDQKISAELYNSTLPEGLVYSDQDGLTIGVSPHTITINPKVFTEPEFLFKENEPLIKENLYKSGDGIHFASDMDEQFWNTNIVVKPGRSIVFPKEEETEPGSETEISANQIRHTYVYSEGKECSFLAKADSSGCKVLIGSESDQYKGSLLSLTSDMSNEEQPQCSMSMGDTNSNTYISLLNSPYESAIAVVNEYHHIGCIMDCAVGKITIEDLENEKSSSLNSDNIYIYDTPCWNQNDNQFYESVIPATATGITHASDIKEGFWDADLIVSRQRSIILSEEDSAITTTISNGEISLRKDNSSLSDVYDTSISLKIFPNNEGSISVMNGNLTTNGNYRGAIQMKVGPTRSDLYVDYLENSTNTLYECGMSAKDTEDTYVYSTIQNTLSESSGCYLQARNNLTIDSVSVWNEDTKKWNPSVIPFPEGIQYEDGILSILPDSETNHSGLRVGTVLSIDNIQPMDGGTGGNLCLQTTTADVLRKVRDQ